MSIRLRGKGEAAPEEAALRSAIRQSGYTYVTGASAPWEKKGLFGRK